MNNLENISLNDFIKSTEAELKQQPQHTDQQPVNTNNTPDNKHRQEAKAAEKRSIIDRIKELPAKANHIAQRAKMWKTKSKHFFFYKKYLDRVKSGLYDKYGPEAPIYENRMKDDPVVILKGPAQEYLQEITHRLNLLYQEVLKMSKDLEDKVTAEQCIGVIKKYCSEYASDISSHGFKINQDKLRWDSKLLNATKFKIAKILMRDGERKIYGYTMRSMVQKGYPKSNYLIVTLFVDNPEEKPEKQRVADIFKSADSFEVIADSDKKDTFSVSGMTEAVLNKTVNNNIMNEIKLSRDNELKAFSHANIPNKKDEGEIIDDIWDGIRYSCKELLSRKEYLINCINVYFYMVLRIDNLAYKSINSMLEIENAHLDSHYKNQVHIGRKADTNKYDEEGNLVSTQTDRQIDYTQANRDKGMLYRKPNSELARKHNELHDITKKINDLN